MGTAGRVLPCRSFAFLPTTLNLDLKCGRARLCQTAARVTINSTRAGGARRVQVAGGSFAASPVGRPFPASVPTEEGPSGVPWNPRGGRRRGRKRRGRGHPRSPSLSGSAYTLLRVRRRLRGGPRRAPAQGPGPAACCRAASARSHAARQTHFSFTYSGLIDAAATVSARAAIGCAASPRHPTRRAQAPPEPPGVLDPRDHPEGAARGAV